MEAEPGRGRRSNGLPAAVWVALGDLDPRVAGALLERLFGHGIAAYAAPAYDADPIGGSAPTPPLRDRLFVDATAVAEARAVLAAETRPVPIDEETAWQQIVASLRREEPTGLAPWPSAEEAGRPARLVRRVEPVAEPLPEPAEEEHFEPPPPPPLPRVSAGSAYAIAAILAGVAVLIVPTMFGDPVGPALLVLAVAAVVGGFAGLVSRMRNGPPTDSGPDDGAVV